MHERFEKRIEDGLTKIEADCSGRKCDPVTIVKRVGRLLGLNLPKNLPLSGNFLKKM